MSKISELPLLDPVSVEGSELALVVKDGQTFQAVLGDIPAVDARLQRQAAETARDEAQQAAASAEQVADEKVAPANDILDGMGYEFVTGTEVFDRTDVGGSETASGVNRSYYHGEVQKDGTGGTIEYTAEGIGSQKIVLMREQEDGTLDEVFVATLTGAGAAGPRVGTFDLGYTIRGRLHAFLYVPNDVASKVRIWTAAGQSIDGEPGDRAGLVFTDRAGVAKSRLTWDTRERKGKGAVARELDKASGAAVPINGVYMGTAKNSLSARTALAATIAGVAATLAIWIGDSNTPGSHTGLSAAEGGTGTQADGVAIPANGTLGYADAFNRSYVAKVAENLPKPLPDGAAIPVRFGGFHGYNNPQGTYTDYNRRVSSTGDWVRSTSPVFSTLGGSAFQSTSSGDNSPLVWNPGDPFDTLVHWGFQRSTGPKQEYSIDGGAYAEIDLTGAVDDYRVTTIPVALGNHEVRLRRKGAVTTLFAGMDTYDSTDPCLRIIPMGFPGSTATSSHAATKALPWNPGALIRTFDCPIKFIMLGTNDIDDGRTVEAYIDAMRQLVTDAMALSTVAVIAPPPQYNDGVTVTRLKQRQVRAALKALCGELGVIFVDTVAILGDYETAVKLGYMDDALHLTPAGAAKLAQHVTFAILYQTGEAA